MEGEGEKWGPRNGGRVVRITPFRKSPKSKRNSIHAPKWHQKRNSIYTKIEETDFRNYERSEHDRRNKIHRRT
jgi:hypothetical protein